MPYQKTSPETIQALFGSIASNYDKGNLSMTLGLHKKWNQKLIDALGDAPDLLDLCAGTGEIAFGFLKKNTHAKALLLDFCKEMLIIAQKKGEGVFQGRFEIIEGDAQAIPLPSNSVGCASISYGIRNVQDPQKCFCEAHRVLKPGGRLGILELTRPTAWLPKMGHHLYTQLILPLIGKITTDNREAYQYLAHSVEAFASPSELIELLKKTGFHNIQSRSLSWGVTTLFVAEKLYS